MRKNVLLLCIGFSFVFVGFGGVQQYLTIILSQSNLGANAGLTCLIILYLAFTLANPIAAPFIAKLGPKKSLIVGAFGYLLFILSVYMKNILFIYLFAAVIGMSASILWTGSYVYLLRQSNDTNRGANSGMFNAIVKLGSAISIVCIGYLLSSSFSKFTILTYSVFPIIGITLFSFMEDVSGQSTARSAIKQVKAAFFELDNLRLASIFFCFMFIYGLVIGIIPLLIKSVLGLRYVGLLSSSFFIIPVLFSYMLGKWSDLRGRKNALYFAYAGGILSLILLYFKSPIGIIIGIVLFAINDSIMNTVSTAIVGDLAKEENLESLNAFFETMRTVGIVTSLIISIYIQNSFVYIVSAVVLFASFLFVLPVLKAHHVLNTKPLINA